MNVLFLIVLEFMLRVDFVVANTAAIEVLPPAGKSEYDAA
jgi:hypothetical protein